ncbi:MAG: hypothetical protein ABIG30_01695 [Candidatus Aenigmatarchaeota archaeon]
MKKQLAIIFILASVLIISGCSSSDNTTVATTATTTSVSGTPTTAATTTTSAAKFHTCVCADMIQESKLTEIIGSQIKYKSQNAVLNQCQYDAVGSASASTFSSNDKYVIYAASYYAIEKMFESGTSTFHETNKVGQASFDYVDTSVLDAGNQLYFLDSSGKYTIRVMSRSSADSPSLVSIDQLYQIAAELDKNTDKITPSDI